MHCSFPSSLDFARAAVPFLKALPRYLRTCADDPSLRYYNTGESGHWAVQSNQQVAGALACLAENPEILAEAGAEQGADELRDLALSMMRYSMRTHVTGDLKCTDGRQWGRHWISVLGLERATPGLSLLRRRCFSPDDEQRFLALVAAECDYRMNEYEVQAALEASTGRNKPESNIWNGAFLLRAASLAEEGSCAEAAGGARGEDSPRPLLLSRGTQFLLNGLSLPEDATDETLVLGRPVREWHVGANFFSDGALDHHGYFNVGYINVCLSNLALAWFWYRERGLPIPEGLLHNARRVWEVAKRFTFPDGRLLRLGGDSRARYTYCQAFALQGWHLAWALWGDEDAAAFARGYLGIIAQEQAENPDGTFYGKRLAGMRAESPWWETRIECDPFTVLCTSSYWAGAEAARTDIGAAGFSPLWRGAFHGAALLRTPVAVRSVVARAFAGPTRPNARNFHETGPAALCVPADRSDLAEWSGNLFAFIGLRGPKHDGKATIEETADGFRWTWEGVIIEDNPLGEGESPYPVLRRRCTAEALPDGRTLRLSDRIECIKETTLPAGFRALHLQIPNDIYNGHQRCYVGDGGFSYESCSYPSSPSLIATGSATLTINGAITVRSLDGKPLSIRRPAGQGALCYNGLTSQYVEEICTDCREESIHLMPGDILCDERYEVEVMPSPQTTGGKSADSATHSHTHTPNPKTLTAAIATLLVGHAVADEIPIRPPGESDSTRRVVAALESAKDGDTLRFEKGVYHFFPDDGRPMWLEPSNNASGEKKVAFPVVGRRDITIDGGGSQFIFHGDVFPFAILRSENVSIMNFTARTSVPPYSLFTVVEKNSEGFAVRVDPGAAPFDIAPPHLCLHALKRQFQQFVIRPDDPQSRDWVPTSFLSFTVENRGDGTLFCRYADDPHPKCRPCEFEIGEPVCLNLAGARERIFCFFEDCRDVCVRDVALNSFGGMGVVAQRTEGVSVDRFSVVPGDGLPVSLTADAMHFINCGGMVRITNCEVANTLDDACNVHGNYLVTAAAEGRTVMLKTGHFEQEGFFPVRVGDTVEFIDPHSRAVLRRAKVESVENVSRQLAKVVLDSAADGIPAWTLVENVTLCPDVVLADNHFRDFPHVRLSGRGKIQMERNRIERCEDGLLAYDLPEYWHESGRIADLTIRDNVFDSCHAYGGGGSYVRIGLSGYGPADSDIPRVHGRVRFSGNRFLNLETGKPAWEAVGVRDAFECVTVEEPIATFVRDADAYRVSQASGEWNEDGFVVSAAPENKSGCWITPARFPGPKPFAAPDAVVVRTRPALGGSITVALKDENTGKEYRFSGAATGEDVRIATPGLDPESRYAIASVTFSFPRNDSVRTFAIRQIDGVFDSSAAEAVRMDADTGNPLHIATDAQDTALAFSNPSATTLKFRAEVRLADFFGRTRRMTLDLSLLPGERRRVAIPSLDGKGLWRVSADIVAADGTKSKKDTRFAFLDPHPVTPRLAKGKFRMGSVYHVERYTPEDRRMATDAAVAIGLKLVRADLCTMERFQPNGPKEWNDAKDVEIVDSLLEHGLDVDAIIYCAPKWAAVPENRGRKWWERAFGPMEKGRFETFCERLARQFGTKIAWYEIGNEWDLRKPGVMDVEDAVAMQAEAWRGLKRGCPEAKVCTTGFATADPNSQQVSMKRFHEDFLRLAKGTFDVHAIHIHGGFGGYAREIRRDFFDLRRRTGTGVPWYSNESAMLPAFGGEDVAARTVWMKVLFAWANGSVDYCWYNLKGCDWKREGSLNDWGLFTADFYPRATAAAVSSLTAVFSGLDFTHTLVQKGSRHAYAFAGDGKIVFGGWDASATRPWPVPVKTDARQACGVDLMGNRSEVEVAGGVAVFGISASPSALVLEGATFAEPDREAIEALPPPDAKAQLVPAGDFRDRAPDFTIGKPEQVRSLYAANPETAYRDWQGQDDLSAQIWLGLDSGALCVLAVVTDDVHCAAERGGRMYFGDSVQMALASPAQTGMWVFGFSRTDDGEPDVFVWEAPDGYDASSAARAVKLDVRREGTRTAYSAALPLDAFGLAEKSLRRDGVRFNLMVNENDGKGRDGWIELAPGISTGRDASLYPFVRFQ